ncbi:uncharacterized protein LOC131951694 [Physella acuta]|uniref:uncharacterized protein LOC131951694 n=1 Tax=Physella acuta TaxID=109671 RepID=UPI0027DB460B|nr:uncharacterized protein LOC131951694 [Physella acuta]
MKEANEGLVVLQNVSASNFQLILKTLYTGEDVLSLDNFIEIWHAVDMLQIEFLVDLCETFASQNIKLENFSEIFSTANLFNSKLVLSSVKTFMIQNFESIYTSKRFLELSFDEMCFIVSSHALHFNSEHPVLELILNWAEYKIAVRVSKAVNNCNENNKKLKTLEPVSSLSYASLKYTQLNSLEDKTTMCADTIGNDNQRIVEFFYDSIERTEDDMFICDLDSTSSENVSTNLSSDRVDELNILLSQVRTCIICPELLMNVLEHRLIKRNDKACQIIVSALLRQMSFRHGQWPKAGVYRQCQEYGNYGISCMNGSGKFLLIDPLDEKRYTLTSCPRLCRNIQLVAFDKELYATGGQFAYQITSDMFVFRDNTWTHVAEIQGASTLLASNGEYIYVTSVLDKVIYRLNPKCNPPSLIKFSTVPVYSCVTHVMSYQIYLIFFCADTDVHMLDLHAKSWTRLDNLEGPSKNIISFRNDDNHFVLQTNGSLWVLRSTGKHIRFGLVAELWSLHHDLFGALLYGEKLVIFHKCLEQGPEKRIVYRVGNAFDSFSFYELSSPYSKLIPVVLPKYCLSECL